MIVYYNRPGIAMAGIGRVLTLIVMTPRVSDVAGLPFLALGITWLICDLVYRFKWGGRRWLHSRYGGQLFCADVGGGGRCCFGLAGGR